MKKEMIDQLDGLLNDLGEDELLAYYIERFEASLIATWEQMPNTEFMRELKLIQEESWLLDNEEEEEDEEE